MKQLCLLCLALTLTPMAWADETAKQYQVEIIIYSQLSQQGIDSEQWPPAAAFDVPDTKVANLVAPSGLDESLPADDIKLLPKSDYKLNALSRLIDRSPNYKPILHLAWLSTMRGPTDSLPIHIQGGSMFSQTGKTIENPTDAEAASLTPQVDGLISIKLRRYFDVTTNLTFSAPLKQIASIGHTDYFNNLNSGLVHFQLLQSRRMRSKELNYLDHPLYGIVMEIFPVG